MNEKDRKGTDVVNAHYRVHCTHGAGPGEGEEWIPLVIRGLAFLFINIIFVHLSSRRKIVDPKTISDVATSKQ